MAKLHVIERDEENRAQVVDLLRSLLSRAEAGEFRSVHVAAYAIDGDLVTVGAGEYSVTDLLAQLEVVKYRVLREHVDGA
jgi:hypothetical protein